jgi:hypothetical protein
MEYKSTRTGISCQDLAQHRAFWRDLLALSASSRALPAHSAGGYRNRPFAIIRNAAWITLYRARLPFPQIGVCAGLAGEAFFTLADRARAEIEPRLRAEFDPDAVMEWGVSPPFWDDRYRGDPGSPAALERPCGRTAYRLGCFVSAFVWWNRFVYLAGGLGMADSNRNRCRQLTNELYVPRCHSGGEVPRDGHRSFRPISSRF